MCVHVYIPIAGKFGGLVWSTLMTAKINLPIFHTCDPLPNRQIYSFAMAIWGPTANLVPTNISGYTVYLQIFVVQNFREITRIT